MGRLIQLFVTPPHNAQHVHVEVPSPFPIIPPNSVHGSKSLMPLDHPLIFASSLVPPAQACWVRSLLQGQGFISPHHLKVSWGQELHRGDTQEVLDD